MGAEIQPLAATVQIAPRLEQGPARLSRFASTRASSARASSRSACQYSTGKSASGANPPRQRGLPADGCGHLVQLSSGRHAPARGVVGHLVMNNRVESELGPRALGPLLLVLLQDIEPGAVTLQIGLMPIGERDAPAVELGGECRLSLR